MRQRQHLWIGEGGCYFLSIAYLGEMISGEVVNDIDLYGIALGRGWMDRDCYIRQPDSILSFITGQQWHVRHEPAEYVPKDYEKVIERWEWKKTMVTLAHFKLPDWDPYGESDTVKYGELVSKRIFWRR